MDSWILRIISHFTQKTEPTFIGVGAADGALNHFRFNNIRVDTIYVIEPGNKRIYLYSDSKDSYKLRLIITNSKESMMEVGVLTARTRVQQINDNFIAIFPETRTMVENKWRFNKNDLLNAMIHTSLSICMYFVRKDPSQSFTFITSNHPDGQIDIDRWMQDHLGCLSKVSEDSFLVLINFPYKATQEEVSRIIKECFSNIAHVKRVQGFDNPILGFALEFTAEL